MTFGAFVGCVCQVAFVLQQYYKYNVAVSETITHQRQATFPAVTFCNMNPVKRSSVGDNSQLSQFTSAAAPASRQKRSEPKQLQEYALVNETEAENIPQPVSLSRNKRGGSCIQ